MTDIKKLAADHWAYVESVLRNHGEDDEIIERCGFHYRTAFEHGWKHAKDEEARTMRLKGYGNAIVVPQAALL